jgi:hypothetical protein
MKTLIVVALFVAAASPSRVKSPLSFELTLPKGFAENPGAVDGDLAHVWMKDAGKPSYQVIAVQRLRGRIGQGCPKGAPPKGLTLFTAEWKGNSVCGLRMEQEANGEKFVDLQFQVPLAREAIGLHVTGYAASEPEVRKRLDELLASLEPT